MARFELDRKWLGRLGYAAFFVACFFVFAYWTFPYDRMRDFLSQEVSRRWRAPAPGVSGPELSIGSIGPAWFFGFAIGDLHLVQAPLQPGRLPVEITLDELEVHPALGSLLTGRPTVDFEATTGDGVLEGTFAQRGDAGWKLDAELDAFDLGRLGIGGTLGVPFKGVATGTVALDMGERTTEDEGDIDLKIENLVLGDGESKVPIPGMPTGLTVDPIDAGTLSVEITIRQGVASIQRLEAEGKDLEIKTSGAFRPVRPLDRVRLDVTLEMAFADAYKSRNDRTRALFDLVGNQPLVKRATTADGKIRLRITGPPDGLRSRPAGGARGSEKADAAKRR